MMSGARTLWVALGERAYPITIGAGLIERAGELLGPLIASRRTIIVTDENLARTAHPASAVGCPRARRYRQPDIGPAQR